MEVNSVKEWHTHAAVSDTLEYKRQEEGTLVI